MKPVDVTEVFHGCVQGLDEGVVTAVLEDSEGVRYSAEFPLSIVLESERDGVKPGAFFNLTETSTDAHVRLAPVEMPAEGQSDGEILARLLESFRKEDPWASPEPSSIR